VNVTPERFSLPLFSLFPLQLDIYPDDLPDDMIFHPPTEVIVFKDTLQDASTESIRSHGQRRRAKLVGQTPLTQRITLVGIMRFHRPS
jgi:hypothetical protein